jgi:F420-0:gamma-glutamyl ligase-like protein
MPIQRFVNPPHSAGLRLCTSRLLRPATAYGHESSLNNGIRHELQQTATTASYNIKSVDTTGLSASKTPQWPLEWKNSLNPPISRHHGCYASVADVDARYSALPRVFTGSIICARHWR